MNLALFDLDNTLLPLDSDHGWSQFLIEKGMLDRDVFEARNDTFYEQYKAGTLDIYEFLDFQLKPLHDIPRIELERLHQAYMDEVIHPSIRASAVSLVEKHRDAGDLCVVITATNRFITSPIVKAFGISHLIATEPEEVNGQFTGKVFGLPSFREGKIRRLYDWLANRGEALEKFNDVYFYSDSMNDLPLLEIASKPVATNPDDKLRAIATERGWPILELFA